MSSASRTGWSLPASNVARTALIEVVRHRAAWEEVDDFISATSSLPWSGFVRARDHDTTADGPKKPGVRSVGTRQWPREATLKI